uniref:Adipose-secreted signaling protein n=1 Tax=Aquila chrysaetos chrysaetos TaxID=223781 RepID=A0A663DJH8_AQUCH
ISSWQVCRPERSLPAPSHSSSPRTAGLSAGSGGFGAGTPWALVAAGSGCEVGFLKILHKYEITFLLPPVQRLGKDVCAVPLPNINLRVIGITSLPEGYSVKCEYTAHKEGVLKEEMVLASEAGEGACIKVVVQARVMDRHHGTPMLLDGVRCIGAELEYDSEQSDWHGFD